MPPSTGIQALLADREFDIEFNGYLSNHAKHAVIALYKLGAPPSRVHGYWESYTTLTPYNLSLDRNAQPWMTVAPCTRGEWISLRGKKEKWPNLCKFLEDELSGHFDNNIDELVAAYAPDLLPGLAGALTHAIIHTGWALDAGSPWMVIEGLAYLNFSYLSSHPENFVHYSLNEASPLDSMKRIAVAFELQNLVEKWIEPAKARYDESSGFHSELIPAGFQWQLSKVLEHQHEVAFHLPSWLDDMNVNQILEEMYKLATLLYLGTVHEKDGHGDFLVLHLITSLWGVEKVLNVVKDDKVSRTGLKCFYVAMVCLLSASSGGFPSSEALGTVGALYYGTEQCDEDRAFFEDGEWASIVERAIMETEEHNIKLVYVTRELWRRYNLWRGFRAAASRFTITPSIGPSSTSFKG